MQLLDTAKLIQNFVDLSLAKNKSIGFVPTMGALHDGHISLVERSVRENDCTIVSIFVNPAQFNDTVDFNKYPRRLEADTALLQSTGCDAVFAPSLRDVYPSPDTTIYDLHPVDKVLEGAFRPGHFNGVASVVKRLFELVNPTRAYFGLKDFQQFLIIKTLCRNYNIPVEIIGCETIREPSGLAQSSRNLLLNNEDKAIANKISAVLFEVKNKAKGQVCRDITALGTSLLGAVEGLELEYFEIASMDSLQPFPEEKLLDSHAVALVAARVNGVRLIDNMVLMPQQTP